MHSELAVTPREFWASMSMKTMNWELRPLVRMTAPVAWQDCGIDQWETERVLFKSWILLFGILPVDRHAFRLRRVDRESGFLESSSSWLNRAWIHERTTVPSGTGCTVIDRVSVVGRFPLFTAFLMPIYKRVFRHRHNRLRQRYGY